MMSCFVVALPQRQIHHTQWHKATSRATSHAAKVLREAQAVLMSLGFEVF